MKALLEALGMRKPGPELRSMAEADHMSQELHARIAGTTAAGNRLNDVIRELLDNGGHAPPRVSRQ